MPQCHGRLLTPSLFNILLERDRTEFIKIMRVSIEGRLLTNLRFADDVDGLTGNEQELARLIERLEEISSKCGMEIRAESLKYASRLKDLWSFVSGESSRPEIISRITLTRATMNKMKTIWNSRTQFKNQAAALLSLVTSIFLYAFASWTLNADPYRRVQALGIRCYRKILGITHHNHITYEEVRKRV